MSAKLSQDVCSECKKTIPGDETPCVWNERVVCGRCYARLKHLPLLPKPAEDAISDEAFAAICVDCRKKFGKFERPQYFHDEPHCSDCYANHWNSQTLPAANPPRAVSYAKASNLGPEEPPNYWVISIVALLLGAAGVLCIVFAIVVLLIGIIGITGKDQHLTGSDIAALPISIVSGIILLGAGEALGCLRDIAQNTFRR